MIGIVSDTHGNTDNAAQALDLLRERDIETVIHCGDIGGAAVVALFAGFDTWFVLGNVDRDYQLLADAVRNVCGAGRLAQTHRLEIGGKRIAVCHGHTEEFDRLRRAEDIDYLLYGHTHRRRDERLGEMRVINPGALGGLRWQSRSFAILDEQSEELQVVEL